MGGISHGAAELLGRQATQVVDAITDPSARERVVHAILVCDDALEVVDSLDLTPHELQELGSPDLQVWDALAPDVRNVLLAVRRAADQLRTLFPIPEGAVMEDHSADVDAAFDELHSDVLPDPIRDARERDLDRWVSRATEENHDRVAFSIAALAGMLQSDFILFGQRLRNPKVAADRWFLLAELHEMKSKCARCLEAVVAAVLSAFTSADLETVLPRYRNATDRAVRLRTVVVELTQDILQLQRALGKAPTEAVAAIGHALVTRLNELGEHLAYQDMRPHDKRAIIQFRLDLGRLRNEAPNQRALATLVEGFARFLEVMRDINQREVLQKHDYSALQTAQMLLESEEEPSAVFACLEQVYGRAEELDVWIRKARAGVFPASEMLAERVGSLLETLRAY